MSTRHSVAEREAVRSAYSVLGDPRLRAEYDAGRPVGVGAGIYYEKRARTAGGRGASRTPGLEARWNRRWNQRPVCGGTPARGVLVVLIVSVVVGVGAAVGQQLGADRESARLAAVLPRVAHAAAAPPAVVRPIPVHRPSFVTGSCVAGTTDRRISPAQRVSCAAPHLFEVVRVLDLTKLLGRPAAKADVDRVDQVCVGEFRAFTGLSGPTLDLWPTTLTEVGGSGPSYATCLADSRYRRSGSVRQIGG